MGNMLKFKTFKVPTTCFDRQLDSSLAVPGALPHCLQRCTEFKSKMAARWPQNSWLGLQRGLLRGNLKKNTVNLKTLSKLRLTPSLLPKFWQIYFWQSVDHVDLPPSPRNFDKNHEILGFEIYIVYYPFYFLRVRGTGRKTQSPFQWIFWQKSWNFRLWNLHCLLSLLLSEGYRQKDTESL